MLVELVRTFKCLSAWSATSSSFLFHSTEAITVFQIYRSVVMIDTVNVHHSYKVGEVIAYCGNVSDYITPIKRKYETSFATEKWNDSQCDILNRIRS